MDLGANAQAPSQSASHSSFWLGLPPPGPVTGQVLNFSQVDLQMIPVPGVRDASELDSRTVRRYIRDEEAVTLSGPETVATAWYVTLDGSP
jgi:hypothetical protein